MDAGVYQFRERFSGLYRPRQIARIAGRYALFREHVGRALGLPAPEVRQRRRPMPAESPLSVSGGLSVSHKIEFGDWHYSRFQIPNSRFQIRIQNLESGIWNLEYIMPLPLRPSTS